MKLRRRAPIDPADLSEDRSDGVQRCPHCGYEAAGVEGRLIDPTTGRVVCVRCGAEIGGPAR